jgi:hypothetical protein
MLLENLEKLMVLEVGKKWMEERRLEKLATVS